MGRSTAGTVEGGGSERKPEPARRLELYRRAARALSAFYDRFSAAFCSDCLAVTRQYHRDDPRADVELLVGQFPGCCHAGVGDALWVPRSGDEGRFSPELSDAMLAARRTLPAGVAEPGTYRVRERQSGLVASGVGCRQLGRGGCRLGELKGPLCIAYLCEPIRAALLEIAGPEAVGSDTDDFAGALEAFRAVVGGHLEIAEAEVAALESRVGWLAERVARWQVEERTTLYEAFVSSENGCSPSRSTR